MYPNHVMSVNNNSNIGHQPQISFKTTMLEDDLLSIGDDFGLNNNSIISLNGPMSSSFSMDCFIDMDEDMDLSLTNDSPIIPDDKAVVQKVMNNQQMTRSFSFNPTDDWDILTDIF